MPPRTWNIGQNQVWSQISPFFEKTFRIRPCFAVAEINSHLFLLGSMRRFIPLFASFLNGSQPRTSARAFSSKRFFNLPIVTVSPSDEGIRVHRLLSRQLRIINPDTKENAIIPQSLLMKLFRKKKFRSVHAGDVRILDKSDTLTTGESIVTDREVYSMFFPDSAGTFNDISSKESILTQRASNSPNSVSENRYEKLKKQLKCLPAWFPFHESLAYCDDHFAVIIKPSNTVSQGGTSLDSVANLHDILQPLGEILSLIDGGSNTLRSAHRLDWGVSGLLVYCRTLEAARHLTAAFRHDEVGKAYIGILPGFPSFLEPVLTRANRQRFDEDHGGVSSTPMVNSEELQSDIPPIHFLQSAPSNLTLHALWSSEPELSFITGIGKSFPSGGSFQDEISPSLALARLIFRQFLGTFAGDASCSTPGTLCAVYHGTVTGPLWGSLAGPFDSGTSKKRHVGHGGRASSGDSQVLPSTARTEGFVFVFRVGAGGCEKSRGRDSGGKDNEGVGKVYRTVMSLHPLSGCKHQLRIHAQAFHGQRLGFFGDEKYTSVSLDIIFPKDIAHEAASLRDRSKPGGRRPASVSGCFTMDQMQRVRQEFEENMRAQCPWEKLLARNDWMSDEEKESLRHFLQKRSVKHAKKTWEIMNPPLSYHTRTERSRAIALHAYGLVFLYTVTGRLRSRSHLSGFGDSSALQSDPDQVIDGDSCKIQNSNQCGSRELTRAFHSEEHGNFTNRTQAGCSSLFLQALTEPEGRDNSVTDRMIITSPPPWMRLLIPKIR